MANLGDCFYRFTYTPCLVSNNQILYENRWKRQWRYSFCHPSEVRNNENGMASRISHFCIPYSRVNTENGRPIKLVFLKQPGQNTENELTVHIRTLANSPMIVNSQFRLLWFTWARPTCAQTCDIFGNKYNINLDSHFVIWCNIHALTTFVFRECCVAVWHLNYKASIIFANKIIDA
jgi:hypothetical protein